ncbi:hypothetical protein ACGTJS_08595 [Faucicola mancuniensis]|uniref:hypothetical protein n=1 Tax=Faucicola mancuniensis TaxID=1309795 RepID=UPI0028F14DA6|nr:hypothetical protein [uncultured Moraxella sp.]
MSKNFDNKELVELYQKGKAFLISQVPPNINANEIVDRYLNLPDGSKNIKELSEIFERILYSAQNANMKVGVIGKSIGSKKQEFIALMNRS